MNYTFANLVLDIDSKDYNRFMEISKKKIDKDGTLIFPPAPNGRLGFEKWQEQEDFLTRMEKVGLIGFRVTSWGMEEHEHYLTDLGKIVRKCKPVNFKNSI